MERGFYHEAWILIIDIFMELLWKAWGIKA